MDFETFEPHRNFVNIDFFSLARREHLQYFFKIFIETFHAYFRTSWKLSWVDPTVLILDTRVIKPSFNKDLFSTIKNPFLHNIKQIYEKHV